MPSGTRPFADGDLYRIQTRFDVRGTTALIESFRPARQVDYARHVCAHVRYMSHERAQWTRGDTRSVRTALVLPFRGNHQATAERGSGAGENARHLHAMPHTTVD